MPTIDDLQPKNFKVELTVLNSDEKLKLDCKPPRLAHTLVLAKAGGIFENPEKADREAIEKAQQDIDWVFGELIPEIKDKELDMTHTVEIIQQIMEQVEPADNKELKERNISFEKEGDSKKEGATTGS